MWDSRIGDAEVIGLVDADLGSRLFVEGGGTYSESHCHIW